MKLSGWGRYPIVDANVHSFRTLPELQALLHKKGPFIGRGLGRSYGDSALGENVISTLHFNRMLAFDDKEGILTCQAGVSLREILDTFAGRGWFPPVVPGTKFVTVGGAIAADIHGKNHHLMGSFSRHVLSIDIALADGSVCHCSRDTEPELFQATCGGMGLTGIILAASIRMQKIESTYICQETVRARNLDEIDTLFRESMAWTYSVAWIDCLSKGRRLGRSVLFRGRHASRADLEATPYATAPLALTRGRELRVPLDFPAFALNNWTVRCFNSLYFNKASAGLKQTIVPIEPFFFPLDVLHDWNKIYGRRGFAQYQFVIPGPSSREAIRPLIEMIADSGESPFLCVLKLFGPQTGCLSFPAEGYTLAVDFPITKTLFSFLDKLDARLREYGGRVYLTKDARLKAENFHAGYSASREFIALKRKYDAQNKFQSLQSKRLEI